MEPKIEEVFKLSGVPTYTFVEPKEYSKLKVEIRSPGRGVIIEGPSGIGKTTAIQQVIDDLEVREKSVVLSARKKSDLPYIRSLPETESHGLVIVDDFHRLDDETQESLANHLKLLADEERRDSKLVIIGINKAGEALIEFGSDLNTRISIIKFEANPDSRVKRLISKGEKSLNINIPIKEEIVSESSGGFYLAQYLCQQTCIQEDVLEKQEETHDVSVSYEVVRERALQSLSANFEDIVITFARGKKFRPKGRAPYLHILKWLSESDNWSINLNDQLAKHTDLKNSVGQVVNKGYLKELIEENPSLKEVFHYNNKNNILSVENPQFIFYIRNIIWNKLAKRAGYRKTYFESKYDFALSFAGTNRNVARRLFKELNERQLEVFFDENEQSRILSEDIEDYLGPIYKSEASYVVCFLGPDYPNRIWTKFESEKFEHRFGSNSVIPVFFEGTTTSTFDTSREIGGYAYNPEESTVEQMKELADLLSSKIHQ